MYAWSVQALDNNYEGSAFAEEAEFQIGNVRTTDLEKNQLKIWPNPVTDKLYISGLPLTGESHLKLFDLSGRLVEESDKNLNQSLDLRRLDPGIYVLNIHLQDHVIRKKLTKK